MNITNRLIVLAIAVIGVQACQTVPYDPATTNDTSAAKPIVLRVDSSVSQLDSSGRPRDIGEASFEAVDRVLDAPQNVRGTVSDTANIDVLATATDNESGIKEVKVMLNRTVYYLASNGSIVSTLFPSIVVATKSYTVSNGRLPQMGAANYRVNIGGQRRFNNANGNPVVGTGVTLQYYAEAKNGVGMTSYTDTVTITAGRVQ